VDIMQAEDKYSESYRRPVTESFHRKEQFL